jgi:hypothetical protein
MHVAYCTARYPARSEVFLRREITYLRAQGVQVTIWVLSYPSDSTADRPMADADEIGRASCRERV